MLLATMMMMMMMMLATSAVLMSDQSRHCAEERGAVALWAVSSPRHHGGAAWIEPLP